MGIYEDNFSAVFANLLRDSGVTCYQISEFTGLNQPYLSRLRSGEKQNPSPETIMKISLALTHYSYKIKLHDIQKLFKSVGRSLLSNDDY